MKVITRKEAKAQGLKRYFTGKPCKRGHVSERFSGDGKCMECKRLHNRQHHAENRDKVLERKRQHYAENPERFRQYREENAEAIREYARQYRAENRERIVEKKRQWYAENREKRLEYNRHWREENREYFIQYHAENREKRIEKKRQYREENPELYVAFSAKRRAAKIDRTLSHEEELTQFVMEEAAQQAKDMEEVFGTPFHVDHMIPMQGENVSGLHVWYNLQVIPAHLNISKGNRMRYTKPLEWLADAA